MDNDRNSEFVSLMNLDDADFFSNCEKFSEGDKDLEEALIALNMNGYQTFACCKGHIDDLYEIDDEILNQYSISKESSTYVNDLKEVGLNARGYLAFKVPNNPNDKIYGIIENLSKIDGVSVCVSKYKGIYKGISSDIYFDINSRKNVLNSLCDYLNSNTYYDSLLFKRNLQLINYLDECCTEFNIVLNYSIIDDKIYTSYLENQLFSYYNFKRNVNYKKIKKLVDCINIFYDYLDSGYVDINNIYYCYDRLENIIKLILSNKNNMIPYDSFDGMNIKKLNNYYKKNFEFDINEHDTFREKVKSSKNTFKEIKDFYKYLDSYLDYIKYEDSLKSKQLLLNK